MTKLQIEKKLAAGGIDMATVICSRDEIEVFVDNGEGRADIDATEAALDAVQKVFQWNGHSTGYGSWVLNRNRPDYNPDLVGFADPMHY